MLKLLRTSFLSESRRRFKTILSSCSGGKKGRKEGKEEGQRGQREIRGRRRRKENKRID